MVMDANNKHVDNMYLWQMHLLLDVTFYRKKASLKIHHSIGHNSLFGETFACF